MGKFTDENNRPPDYRYLSDCLTNNVLSKEYLFHKREKNQMSVEHFVIVILHYCVVNSY